MNQAQQPRKGRLSKRGVIILAVLAALVAVPAFFGFDMMLQRHKWPANFQNNGERIYFTAKSASGIPIYFDQGESVHMGMMGGGCVDCHGTDRRGGRLMHRFWTAVPPLTPAALFREHLAGGKKIGHDDHKAYTDETLRRAITHGLDPEGKPFDQAMPKWSMSERDLNDLIGYLKSPAGISR